MVTLNADGKLQHKYYDAYSKVHNYNASIPNLTTGEKYNVQLSVFHSDHCVHHRRQSVEFFAKDPCSNYTRCPSNSTCHSNFYTGEPVCQCDHDFAPNNKSKCIDLRPCSRKACGANQTCRENAGKRICECKEMFANMNGTCRPIIGKIDKCKLYPEAIGCITIRKELEKDNKAIIAGVVPAIIIVILIAAGIVIWLRYFHKKRMVFMQREFEDAIASGSHGGTLTNPYDYQHPIELVSLPEGSSKEMNLLYVLQEDLVIPEDLKGSIDLFELPGERVRLRSMIGKGAFGEVYIGEAQGVNNNPEWTTVAIKTLTEAVTEEDVHDFLREIELMKDLGKHENVIQMYGCCTRCRPICLVLEYASGGNLLNHLKSLKKKCKEIAAARVHAFINSEK
ncbi:Titin, partial [Paramuricea clavata]